MNVDKAEITRRRMLGQSYRQIATALCTDRDTVRNYCVRHGLSGVRSEYDSRKKHNEIICELHSKRPDLKYIGGYTNNVSNITVQCTACHNIYEIGWHTVMYTNAECPYCKEIRIREREAQIVAERESKNAAKREALEQRASEQIKRQIEKTNLVRICKECGDEYSWIGKDYRSKEYCSKACANRYKDRNKRRLRDERLMNRRRDTDITLEKLFKRDGGTCYICGCHCDYEDYVISGDAFIAGNRYPSIDHIIPVAKGGTDTWDNIKLACRRCNSIKGTR